MEYIMIRDEEEQSCGGNQLWLSESRLSSYGCGVIAVSDIILYFFYHDSIMEELFCSFLSKQGINLSKNQHGILDKETYCHYIELMEMSYFPINPLVKGVTGIRLMKGFNQCAEQFGIPYFATWAVPKKEILTYLQGMLQAEMPVLLSIGPNAPSIWRDIKIPFYKKEAEGKYQKEGMINSHYVTVVGVELSTDEVPMLAVSSWGKKYYLNWQEYQDYVKKYSWTYFNNILLLQKKEFIKKQEWSFGME